MVRGFYEMLDLRTTGVTGANADSSRSHAVMQISLVHKKQMKHVHGKLSFIDLVAAVVAPVIVVVAILRRGRREARMW